MFLEDSGDFSYKTFEAVEDVPYFLLSHSTLSLPLPSPPFHFQHQFSGFFRSFLITRRFVLPKQMNGVSYSVPWVTQQILEVISLFFNLVLDEGELARFFFHYFYPRRPNPLKNPLGQFSAPSCSL
jgi:hypothetical protein